MSLEAPMSQQQRAPGADEASSAAGTGALGGGSGWGPGSGSGGGSGEVPGGSSGAKKRPAWRSAKVIITAVVLLALIGSAIFLAFSKPDSNHIPLSIHNSDPNGARAVGQILSEHGVKVTEVRTTDKALSKAKPGTTLAILHANQLSQQQQQALAKTGANIVLLDPGYGDLSNLTGQIKVRGGGSPGIYQASCSDPAARAAGEISTSGPGIETSSAIGCFPLDSGDFAYAAWKDSNGQDWRAIAQGGLVSNAYLAESGNAALALWTLGSADRLTWYIPSSDDHFGETGEATISLLPSALVLQLVLIVVAIAFWRGRRLGPVIVEPLPVHVRATETTLGRGRLYRIGKSYQHAGAALRAGTLSRLCPRIGLPASASSEQVCQALAQASGRSEQAIYDLFYSPGPTTEESMMALVQALDVLESEVHA